MRRALWLSAAVIALDQLTKWAALKYLARHAELTILPFINLTLVYNRGAAFGFLSEAGGWQNAFFIAVAVIASVVIAYLLYRTEPGDHIAGGGLALILGGAIGNVIDRVMHGHVIDFIDIYYRSWHWPAFNIADSAITIGAIGLVVSTFMTKKAQERPTE